MTLLSLCLLSWGALCLLAVSYAVYLLYFHPYAKYPGPLLARLTPFHSLWHAYIGDLHLDVLHCHEIYGDIVRYGPNRLLINRPEAVRAIYGQGKNFKKSSAYAPHPFFPAVFNTHNCIEPSQHGRKRRIVAQGFSEGSLAAYEPSIIEQVDALCTALASDIGSDGWSQPKDMANWTNYFTLDVISILTFGSCFNLLSNPHLRWLIQAIVQGNRHIYLRFAFPLLFNLNPEAWYAPGRWLFPDLTKERDTFVDLANEMTSNRANATSNSNSLFSFKDQKPRRDIISELEAAHDPKTNSRLTPAEIASEAHLMIAAGGDTTSTALSAVLFYLSRSPTSYALLTSEIRTLFTDVSQIRRGSKLSSARYLRACIDEALRLAPAAPGALWRQAGRDGAFVEEVFVPGGLEVGTCIYALSHDVRYFHQPFVFKPERWLGREVEAAAATAAFPTKDQPVHEVPDISISTRLNCYTDASFFYPTQQQTTNAPTTTTNNTPQLPLPLPPHPSLRPPPPDTLSASTPFSIGPRSCLAKPLAYLELSLALARLVYLFDFESVDDTGCGGAGRGRGRWWGGEEDTSEGGWWENRRGRGRGRERVDEFQIVDMFSSGKEGPVLRFRKWERTLGG